MAYFFVLDDRRIPTPTGWIHVAALGAFFAFGAYSFIRSLRPIVFDQAKGVFYKRWKPPKGFDGLSVARAALLNEVHAAQVLRKLVAGDQQYASFELNLVLRDGRRLNVIDHANGARLRADAERLAKWLGCKLWDATAVLV